MKQIINLLRENLDITLKEAKSTLAFIVVAFFSFVLYLTVNYWTTTTHQTIVIEQLKNVKPSFEQKREETPLVAHPKTISKFKFDPNTTSKEDFIKLGLPAYVANTIINYRNKGGKFKYKSDLEKIYSLKPELYAELSPWINLPEKSSSPSQYEPEIKAPPIVQKIKTFDINTADTTILKQVRGIGSTYANRIIKFRDALGGFHDLAQLNETYNISPESITELKKYTTIQSKVKTIAINEVETFKHPYLKQNQIKAILSYRQQHGKFQSADDLQNIKILSQETIDKITPYLSF